MVKFGVWAILAYLFTAFSRMSETIAALFGVAPRLPMVLLALALVGVAFQPSLVRAVQNRIGLILSLLSFWFLVCIPFSVHRGGSVGFIIGFWLVSVLACVCVMVLGQSVSAIRRMLYAIVSGILLLLILSIVGKSYPSLQAATGSMTNPNLYGQHLLYTLPFLFLPIFRHGLFSARGLIAAAGGLLIFARVAFTGSRASLLAIGVLVLLVFFRLPFVKKLGMVLASIPAGLMILLLMPDMAWERYATILRSDIREAQTGEEKGAIESANSRQYHLQQSIELTFLNPVFGVGPGMFPVASADYSRKQGGKARWKETHNSYTQISSETGLPGLLLYISLLAATVLAQWKVMRMSRGAPEHSVLAECGAIAYSLFLSMAVTLVTGTFSSVGYQFYFPLLGAFSITLLGLTAREMAVARNTPAPDPKSRSFPRAGPRLGPSRFGPRPLTRV